MKKAYCLMACGGHGLVALDTALSAGVNIVAILDTGLPEGALFFGVPVIAGGNNIPQHIDGWINGLGANPDIGPRRALYEDLAAQHECPPIIHPSATLGREVELNAGAQIMAGAIVQAKVSLGENTVVNTGARIDHHCVIGSHSFISPAAVLCGNVKVAEGCFIGAGAILLPGVELGRNSIIAAGSVVRKSVPEGHKFIGRSGHETLRQISD